MMCSLCHQPRQHASGRVPLAPLAGIGLCECDGVRAPAHNRALLCVSWVALALGAAVALWLTLHGGPTVTVPGGAKQAQADLRP